MKTNDIRRVKQNKVSEFESLGYVNTGIVNEFGLVEMSKMVEEEEPRYISFAARWAASKKYGFTA